MGLNTVLTKLGQECTHRTECKRLGYTVRPKTLWNNKNEVSAILCVFDVVTWKLTDKEMGLWWYVSYLLKYWKS